MVRKTASSKRSGGHGARSGASQGRAASTKSSTDMARRYSLFIHSSFFRSKNAGAWFTSDSSKPATISSTDEDLAPLGVAPPQQRQVVAHGVGQVAPLPVGLDRPRRRGAWTASGGARSRAGAGGRRRAAAASGPSSADHRSRPLGVDGRRSSPRMTWVMRHVDVVDHVGQHEQRRARRLHHHEVLDGLVGEDHVAADEVVDHRRPLVGDPEAQRPPLAVEAPVAAEAVVAGCGVAPWCGRRSRRGCTRRRRARPPPTGCRWPGLVGVGARRLPEGPLVGLHAQPRQRRQDAVDPLLAVALGVGVLDAQDEDARRCGGRRASCRGRPGRCRRGGTRWATGRSGPASRSAAAAPGAAPPVPPAPPATGATRPRRA